MVRVMVEQVRWTVRMMRLMGEMVIVVVRVVIGVIVMGRRGPEVGLVIPTLVEMSVLARPSIVIVVVTVVGWMVERVDGVRGRCGHRLVGRVREGGVWVRSGYDPRTDAWGAVLGTIELVVGVARGRWTDVILVVVPSLVWAVAAGGAATAMAIMTVPSVTSSTSVSSISAPSVGVRADAGWRRLRLGGPSVMVRS